MNTPVKIKRRMGRQPGPRPDLWAVGPDPLRHAKHIAWARSRAQAHFRGETWNLTFEEYEQFWGDQWHRRSRQRGGLMLMRKDWHEPWSVANCFLGDRDNYHYQQLERKLENGTISEIHKPRPDDQP